MAPATGSHLGLLEHARALAAHARALQGASDVADLDVLHQGLCDLRNALVEHVHAEQVELDALPGPVRHTLADGQRRLLRLVDEIMADSALGGEDCDCVARSTQLIGTLAAQARVEARVLLDHARRRSDR